ncbi:MAG TPA: CoA transferase [Dehalococcoidia bacterium]|nr:CoA transferase [Dehalococcoidia bacterium]
MTGGPLSGLVVVDFSTWMAGPLATMVMADLGAEVIKVEPPWGDPARRLPAFQTWNRGKKGVILDLKSEEGRRRAHELVRGADVVVVSFRPGVAERLGIGYGDCRALNEAVVYASITGFGEDGDWQRLKGYEALVAAKSGRMMEFEGIADRPGPGYAAVPCASYSAAMLALQGVMAALHKRQRTGQGQKVEVSLLGALMPFDMVLWIGWQLKREELQQVGGSAQLLRQALLGQRVQPAQGAPPGHYDPTRIHRPRVRVPRPNFLTAVTRDGRWVQFANTTDRLCVSLMEALDLLHLYGEERFAKLPAVFTEEDAEHLWERVLERVRQKTLDEWRDIFDQRRDLAWEEVRFPWESHLHRQVLHNGHFVAVPGLRGEETLQPGPLFALDGGQPTSFHRAPLLGEHTHGLSLPSRQPPPVAAGSQGGTDGCPLSGVTVLDFSSWIAGPLAVSMLATLGARVIKIEPVGGDLSRFSTAGLLAFPMTQGKESLAVDLTTPEGREIVHRLVRRADVLVHNFRADVPRKLGIDYETCRRLNPELVYVNASAYGDSGPDAGKPAFHATIAALAGNQARQAGAGHPPRDIGGLDLEDLKREAWRLIKAAEGNADPIASLGTAAAVLVALYLRDRHRRGYYVVTTMVASNIYANSDEAIVFPGRPAGRPVDEQVLGLGPLYRLYRAGQGWVFLACVQPSEWSAFCSLVGRQDLVDRWDEAWGTGADSLAQELESLFLGRSAREWEEAAAAADVPLVAVEERDPGRFFMEDERMLSLGYSVDVVSPVHGRYRRHGAYWRFSHDRLAFGPWEPLGGHTVPILRELGYSDEEVSALLQRGVVEAWEGGQR